MSWRDAKWKYVPARDMTPDYLASKFRRMLNKQKANDKEAVAKVVEPFKEKKRA